MTTTYNKPVPVPQGESDYYWERAKQHELWLRSCNDCGQAYFYPRDISPCCFSKDTSWIQASGRATLHTFAVVYRASHPTFRDAPYVVALVDLEEGPRMATNIVGIGEPAPEKLTIGMDLEVTFEDITDEITLPKFKTA